MATLMTPTFSTAGNYGTGGPQGNNGWGNGDQTAPGGSGPNNNAENNTGGKTHPIHGNSNP